MNALQERRLESVEREVAELARRLQAMERRLATQAASAPPQAAQPKSRAWRRSRIARPWAAPRTIPSGWKNLSPL